MTAREIAENIAGAMRHMLPHDARREMIERALIDAEARGEARGKRRGMERAAEIADAQVAEARAAWPTMTDADKAFLEGKEVVAAAIRAEAGKGEDNA